MFFQIVTFTLFWLCIFVKNNISRIKENTWLMFYLTDFNFQIFTVMPAESLHHCMLSFSLSTVTDAVDEHSYS